MKAIKDIEKKFDKKLEDILRGLMIKGYDQGRKQLSTPLRYTLDTDEAVTQFMDIKSLIRQQILALLEEIKAEMPKKKSDKQTAKEIKDFPRRLDNCGKQTIRAKNYGYNSALEDIKTILQNKIKEGV